MDWSWYNKSCGAKSCLADAREAEMIPFSKPRCLLIEVLFVLDWDHPPLSDFKSKTSFGHDLWWMTKRWLNMFEIRSQVSEAKSRHSIIYFLAEKKLILKMVCQIYQPCPHPHLYVLVYCQSKHRQNTQFSIQTCIQFEDIHGFSQQENLHLQRIFPAFPRYKPPFTEDIFMDFPMAIFPWHHHWVIAMVHLAQLSPELCRELSAELPSRCGAAATPATRNVELNDAQAGDGNFGKLWK